MKNVLFLSYDGMTDPLGQSQVIPYLAGLSNQGYSITLISFEKPERFEKNKDTIQSILVDAKIDWKSLIYTKNPPVFSTIFDIMKLNKLVRKLHKKKCFKIVHCRGYITAFTGVMMKKRFGAKFVFDMRGFFADERVEGGLWNRFNPLFNWVYKFFKKKEIQFFKTADYSICLTNKGKQIIHNFDSLKDLNVPIEVIPCCADLNLFSSKNIDINKVAEYKNKFGIADNDLVISYLGSVGTWYMLDEMMDFFAVLRKSRPAKLIFITQDEVSQIFSSAKQRGISEVDIIVHPANRKDLPSLLAVSSVSLFFIKPVFSKQASSPTKMGELMGLSIPIICNSGVGDVDEIVNATQCGELVNSFDEKEYQRIVDSLEQIVRIDKFAITSGAESYYSLLKGVEKYAGVYKYCLES